MGYNKLNNSVYQTKSFIGSEAQNNIESEVFMVLKKNNNFQQINTFPLDVYKITKPDWVTVQQTLTAYDTNYYKFKYNVLQNDGERRQGDIVFKHIPSGKSLTYNIEQLAVPVDPNGIWTNSLGAKITSIDVSISGTSSIDAHVLCLGFIYNGDQESSRYRISGSIKNGIAKTVALNALLSVSASSAGPYLYLTIKPSAVINIDDNVYTSSNGKIRYFYNGTISEIDLNCTISKTSTMTVRTGSENSSTSDDGGGGCCFVAGSQILITKTGKTKSIEDIHKGDKLISYNRKTQKNYISTVDFTVVKGDVYDIATLTLEDGKSVTMNAYHPILTIDGWKSITNFNGYPTLCENDYIKTIDGYSKLKLIERKNSEQPVTMYNIGVIDDEETEDININKDDNFYVNGICAHNTNEHGTQIYGIQDRFLCVYD